MFLASKPALDIHGYPEATTALRNDARGHLSESVWICHLSESVWICLNLSECLVPSCTFYTVYTFLLLPMSIKSKPVRLDQAWPSVPVAQPPAHRWQSTSAGSNSFLKQIPTTHISKTIEGQHPNRFAQELSNTFKHWGSNTPRMILTLPYKALKETWGNREMKRNKHINII